MKCSICSKLGIVSYAEKLDPDGTEVRRMRSCGDHNWRTVEIATEALAELKRRAELCDPRRARRERED